MHLDIKSEEVHELARLTGESLTQAVTAAVKERLDRVRGERAHVQARADVLLAIGRETARRLSVPVRSLDHGDLLYDERGLPR